MSSTHHQENIESGAFKSNASIMPSISFENFDDLKPACDQPSFEEEYMITDKIQELNDDAVFDFVLLNTSQREYTVL